MSLKGGVIASTAGRESNALAADHLSFADIANRSTAKSSSLGLALGATKDGGLGLPVPQVGQPAKEDSAGTARATLTPANSRSPTRARTSQASTETSPGPTARPAATTSTS